MGQAKRLMRTALGVSTRPKMSCLESINILMLSESIVGTAGKAGETRWRNYGVPQNVIASGPLPSAIQPLA